MNTNSIPYLEQAIKINDTLLGLPALPLVAVGCLAIGYFFKALPVYRNRWIPSGVFIFGVLANLTIVPIDNKIDFARAFILGLVAGGAAIIIHRKFLSKYDDAFASSDTAKVEKPKDP